MFSGCFLAERINISNVFCFNQKRIISSEDRRSLHHWLKARRYLAGRFHHWLKARRYLARRFYHWLKACRYLARGFQQWLKARRDLATGFQPLLKLYFEQERE